ncbi:hypothetical protein STEG23_017785 [Scotinomys teguina]
MDAVSRHQEKLDVENTDFKTINHFLFFQVQSTWPYFEVLDIFEVEFCERCFNIQLNLCNIFLQPAAKGNGKYYNEFID